MGESGIMVHRVCFNGGIRADATHVLLVEVPELVSAQDLETNSFIGAHFWCRYGVCPFVRVRGCFFFFF